MILLSHSIFSPRKNISKKKELNEHFFGSKSKTHNFFYFSIFFSQEKVFLDLLIDRLQSCHTFSRALVKGEGGGSEGVLAPYLCGHE